MSVLVELSGGFGNQMFQYAAGYALARRLGKQCTVDVGIYSPRNPVKYQLDRFLGAPEIASAFELPLRSILMARGVSNKIFGRAPFVSLGLRRIRAFNEGSAFVFDRRFLDIQGEVYLRGYYQSEKYFDGYADDIRGIFEFKNAPSPENSKIMDLMAKTDSVSVHIRRGDYVSSAHTNQYHGTCPVSYYSDAFKLLGERCEKPFFFVFSDDPAWCKANIHPPGGTVYIDHNRGDDSPEDMRLMARCRHHVIANSSFSWWGAWLNPYPEKIVVAPRKWLETKSVQVLDLIPESWVTL